MKGNIAARQAEAEFTEAETIIEESKEEVKEESGEERGSMQ